VDNLDSLEARIETLQNEKSVVRAKLQAFQEKFVTENNRKIRFHKDILPIEREYRLYKNLKEEIMKAVDELKKLKAKHLEVHGTDFAPTGKVEGSRKDKKKAAPAPAAPVQFGSTPAPAPNSSFGSAPAFGSTATAAPVSFGAPTQGSFNASSSAPGPFGPTSSTPSLTQPFGAQSASGFNTPNTFGSAQQPGASTGGVSGPGPFGGMSQNSSAGGFGVGFGHQAPPPQQAQPGGFNSNSTNMQFSLGTGGSSSSARPGRRRIVKARRPR